MRIKVLGRLLCIVGGLGLLGSYLWWQTFYTDVMHFLGSNGPMPTECLYSFGGPCGMVNGTAAMLGAAAYDPKALWVSGAIFIVGLFCANMPDQYTDDFSSAKGNESRRDPTL